MEKTAGRREWLGLAVLVLPTLLVSLDLNALFLALPRLSADLGASGTEQLWITDGYGFMVAGLVITMGTLGDRIGRRRLLLTGGAAFGAVSVVAAFATSPEMLIASRVLLGVAGATLMPSTLALITTMFRDAGQRGRAIAAWATCQFAGAALGPVFGGFLLQHFWWGSVFLIAVPVMVVLLVAGPVLLPEFRADDPGRLDLVGVALSLAAILPVVYGLKKLAVEGGVGVPLAAIAAGAAVGVVFVRRQLRLDDPLLDLRLLRNRPFSAVLVGLVFAGLAMAGVGVHVVQYLQSVLGHPPAEAALLFAPMGLGVAAGTMAAPALAKRMRPSVAIAAGLAVSVPGALLLALVDADGGLPFAIAGVTILALGTGPLFALGTGLVVGSVPQERAGSAASMSETGNFFGASLGIALLGALGTGVYQGRMPGEAPAEARETLAGATETAGHLPPERAADLLDAARSAFTDGLNATGLVSAAVFVGLALLFATLREAPAREPELSAV